MIKIQENKAKYLKNVILKYKEHAPPMYVSGSRGHLSALTAKTEPKALNNGVEKR